LKRVVKNKHTSGSPAGARERTREKLEDASKRRLGTPDWRSFIRDMHMVEQEQRRKMMHSLPELERQRSQSPRRGRRGRESPDRLPWKSGRSQSPLATSMDGVMARTTPEKESRGKGGGVHLKFAEEGAASAPLQLPRLVQEQQGGQEAGGGHPIRPKTGDCQALLESYLNPNNRMKNASMLILEPEGLVRPPDPGRKNSLSPIGGRSSSLSHTGGKASRSLSFEDAKSTVSLVDVLSGAATDTSIVLKPRRPPPEMFHDDLMEYQPGVFTRNERGQTTLRPDRVFLPNLDPGLAMQKATSLCRMMNLKSRIKAAEATKGEVHKQERVRKESQVDFVKMNRFGASEARKDIVRARMIHKSVERAHRQLEVQDKAMTTELAWRRKVEEELTVRQERQQRRLLQTRWLPVFFCFLSVYRAREIVLRGFIEREDAKNQLAATLLIQRAIRRRNKRRYMLMLGPQALTALKHRARRWVQKTEKARLERVTACITKWLMEIRANNKFLKIVKVFMRKVIMCQRYTRAFLEGQHKRRQHMHSLWDSVVRDVVGDSDKHSWMLRVLNKSGAKQINCDKELRNMRNVFMHELRYYKNSLKAYTTKLEAFGLIKDMGMNEGFVRERLGVEQVPPRPQYPIVCNRKVMRKHVEDAVEACGIEDFVHRNLQEDLKEKIDAMIIEMQDKITRRLMNNETARYIFNSIDTDGSGMLEEEEIHRLLDALEVTSTFHEARGLFQRLDIDASGSISYPEFVDRVMNWRMDKSDAEEHYSEVFEKRKAQRKAKLLKRWGIAADSDYANTVMQGDEKKRASSDAGSPLLRSKSQSQSEALPVLASLPSPKKAVSSESISE